MQNKITRIQERLFINNGEKSPHKSMHSGIHGTVFGFWNNPARLQKSIYIVGLLLVLVSISFGLFYVTDRYIRIDDLPLLEQSMDHYEGLIQDNPQNVDLRNALAGVYLESGKYKEAIEETSQVLTISPENEQAFYIEGLAYTLSGDSEAALYPLKQFVSLRQDSPYSKEDNLLETALYNLGINHIRLGEPESAIDSLLEALNMQPTNADVLFSLGFAYKQLGENSNAIEAYENVVFYVPDYLEAYQQLFELYSQESPWLMDYSRGAIAFCEGDYQTAQKYLSDGISDQPEHAPSHAMLGMVHEKMGNYDVAKSEYQTAISLYPNYFLAKHSLKRVEKLLLTTNSPPSSND